MKNLLFLVALLFASPLHAKLTISRAGPVGVIANIAEANEVRVVFSEPMVAVGKIPTTVTAQFFHMTPPVKGTFRWSGTTTLIFTPDPKTPLPFATKFDVTIDATAKSVGGETLDHPYTFSFTTPTIQLLKTNWVRKGGRFDAPVVIALYFNQPVDGQTIAPHLQLRTVKHDFHDPNPPALDRLKQVDPQAVEAFQAKVAAARAAADSNETPVLSFFPAGWDTKRFPSSPDLVVVETKPGVRPDTWLQVYLDDRLVKTPSQVRTGRSQSFTIQLAPTFFVDHIACTTECDPERYNSIVLRGDTSWEKLRAAVHVTDVTDPAREAPVTPEAREAPDWRSTTRVIGLDELGYSLLPARNYAVRVDSTLEAEDGQTLGSTWMAVIENWHKPAFLSFGDGHGVWESSGGPVLPFHARNFRNITQWLMPMSIEQMMPAMLDLEKEQFHEPPAAAPGERKLAPVADKTQSYGLNLKSAIGANGTGLVWAAVKAGETIPRSRSIYEENEMLNTVATLVQVTNLGISVKDSPQNTLVLVTRLDDAAAVAGAKVSIRTADNKIFWSGATDERGMAIAPNTSAVNEDIETSRAR